jgi:hypothetical protein
MLRACHMASVENVVFWFLLSRSTEIVCLVNSNAINTKSMRTTRVLT